MDVLLGKLPRLPNCCICLTVVTGALIIGYVQLFGGVINFITDCVDLSYLSSFVTNDSNTTAVAHTLIGIYVFDLLVQCLFIIVSLWLIMGVHKQNPRYIFIWLMVMIILLPLKLISAILYVAYGLVGAFFGFLFVIVVEAYFFLVINTVYQDFESGGAVNY